LLFWIPFLVHSFPRSVFQRAAYRPVNVSVGIDVGIKPGPLEVTTGVVAEGVDPVADTDGAQELTVRVAGTEAVTVTVLTVYDVRRMVGRVGRGIEMLMGMEMLIVPICLLHLVPGREMVLLVVG
jgi:hypothetical protein